MSISLKRRDSHKNKNCHSSILENFQNFLEDFNIIYFLENFKLKFSWKIADPVENFVRRSRDVRPQTASESSRVLTALRGRLRVHVLRRRGHVPGPGQNSRRGGVPIQRIGVRTVTVCVGYVRFGASDVRKSQPGGVRCEEDQRAAWRGERADNFGSALGEATLFRHFVGTKRRLKRLRNSERKRSQLANTQVAKRISVLKNEQTHNQESCHGSQKLADNSSMRLAMQMSRDTHASRKNKKDSRNFSTS